MSLPNSPPLEQLRRLDRSSSEFHDQLSNVLYGEEYQKWVPNLEGDDLVWLVDCLDRALDGLDPSGPASRKCLRELRSVCGARGILPTSYTHQPHLLNIDTKPFASGGYGDVYHGTLNGSSVCIKCVRVYTSYGPQKAAKAFCQEAVMWKRLTHPNILPLLGITIVPPQLISDWMPGGDLPEYIRKNPEVNRLGLLSDATKGLCYLHSCNVVHGDLKGQNILVDSSGRVRIADFGLAKVAQNLDSVLSASHQNGHTPRWTAPEILKEEVTCSKEADIFSFAMVMIEIFTGAIPFGNSSSVVAAIAIVQGRRPPRPTHPTFTEDLWALMQRCWRQDPCLRPGVPEVLEALHILPLSSPSLQRLRRLDRSSPGFHDQVCSVLHEEEYQKCVPNLQGDDLVWLVEYLNEVLDGLDPSGPAFRTSLRELRRICGTKGILPTSYILSPDLLAVGSNPFAWGAYGDVYQGTLDGSRVCIKRMRVYNRDGPDRAAKIFCREAVMWKRLTHTNIVPLLGVTIDPFQLVSDLVSGGDLPNYMKTNPNADRPRLLSDVAEGLCYLHVRNIVHGSLKGPDILVDDTGRARITDFGQATVSQSLDALQSASWHGNTPRWAAPEVLDGQPPSKESDIFSFAMVMIEVYTGAVPFSTRSTPMSILAMLEGDRPPRPTHPTFTEHLWKFMQRCWDQQPHLRPEASEVSQVLLTIKHPLWKQLISDAPAAHDRSSLIGRIFSNRNEAEMVVQLSGDDSQAFIDAIAGAMDSLAPGIRMECLHYLYRICGYQALLPKSLTIPLCYDPMESPLCHGEFADVWKGRYRGLDTAAKVLKVRSNDGRERTRRRFCQEVVVWGALHHPNVLSLLGVTMAEDQLVAVSEWMMGNTIIEFVEANIKVDRLGLLGDVARGLIYMHDQGIIHGGLSGANILINHSDHACLAGFGQLTIASDQPTTVPSAVTGDAIRWISPELIDPSKFNLKESRPTKKSDCYALGMVIYEVLSGQVPFASCEYAAIASTVVGGERPRRPQGGDGARFTDGLWWMLEDCWKPQPDDRPSLDIVLGCLQDGGKLFARLRRGSSKKGWASESLRNLKAFKFTSGKPSAS